MTPPPSLGHEGTIAGRLCACMGMQFLDELDPKSRAYNSLLYCLFVVLLYFVNLLFIMQQFILQLQ